MLSQKFCVDVAKNTRGNAARLPNMQTHAFVILFFFSKASLIKPPKREEANPQIERAAALANAN